MHLPRHTSCGHNKSSAIQCFECGGTVKICEEIIFNFYMGLLHVIHKNFAASLLIYKVTADRENFAVKEFRG